MCNKGIFHFRTPNLPAVLVRLNALAMAFVINPYPPMARGFGLPIGPKHSCIGWGAKTWRCQGIGHDNICMTLNLSVAPFFALIALNCFLGWSPGCHWSQSCVFCHSMWHGAILVPSPEIPFWTFDLFCKWEVQNFWRFANWCWQHTCIFFLLGKCTTLKCWENQRDYGVVAMPVRSTQFSCSVWVATVALHRISCYFSARFLSPSARGIARLGHKESIHPIFQSISCTLHTQTACSCDWWWHEQTHSNHLPTWQTSHSFAQLDWLFGLTRNLIEVSLCLFLLCVSMFLGWLFLLHSCWDKTV